MKNIKNIIKKGVALVGLFFCSIILSAQTVSDTEIPIAVRKAINTQFPAVKEIKWERTKDNLYAAVFSLNGKYSTVFVTEEGGIVNRNNAVNPSFPKFKYRDIPLSVRKHIEMKCNPSDMITVNKLKDKNGSDVYEIELPAKKIFFDKNGDVLNEFSK